MGYLGYPSVFGAPIQSQGADFLANNKPNPGFMVAGTEQGAAFGGWREVAGTFWTLENADYIGGQWQLLNPSFAAWAFALLQGGGLAMYTAPAGSAAGFTWTRLFYVDNTGTLQSPVNGGITIGATTDFSGLTIYNYQHYGAATSASATVNSTAMVNMLTAVASSPSGGECWIPNGNFQINPGPYTVPDQTTIHGLGNNIGGNYPSGGHNDNKAQLAMAGDGILFSMNGNHYSGGRYFQNLCMTATSPTLPTTTAVFASDWNCRLLKCNVSNFPVAFNATSGALSCGMEQCTVQLDSSYNGPNGGGPGGSHGGSPWALVVLSSPQVYFVGPGEMLQPPNNSAPFNTTVAISMQNGVVHATIRDMHISDFAYGITYGISGTQAKNTFQSLHMTCLFTDIYMQPVNSTGQIYGEKFIGCTFEMANWQGVTPAGSQATTPIVYLDTNSGPNNTLADILFSGCTIIQGGGHGLQINAGQEITVIGCTIEGNGQTLGNGSGIAITGSPSSVLISDCQMNAKYANAPSGIGGSQAFAILISGSPNEVLVKNCTMYAGYAGVPISVTGSPTNFIVRDCAGYNDQGYTVGTGVATGDWPSSPTNAAGAGSLTGGMNYYGATDVYFTAPSGGFTFTKNGIGLSIPANQSMIIYNTSPYDNISFSAAPTQFRWIGR